MFCRRFPTELAMHFLEFFSSKNRKNRKQIKYKIFKKHIFREFQQFLDPKKGAWF